jgi:protein-L-isoaspartate(D-aspartate) O-methyltransferase
MSATNGTRRQRDYAAARETMVRDQLQRRGITDAQVLQAMRDVPRHLFVPPESRRDAYGDRPLPIAEGQTISQPYMVAVMVQSLGLSGNARVLEVGTGSGYQAAVLGRLAAQVYTIEYFPILAEQARAILERLGYTNVRVIIGDGSVGLLQYAPYDGIVVPAAAPRVPPPLIEQLGEGGRLVIPVGKATEQELLIITKRGASYTRERSVSCRFVPLLGQAGWPEPGEVDITGP